MELDFFSFHISFNFLFLQVIFSFLSYEIIYTDILTPLEIPLILPFAVDGGFGS